MIYLDKSFVYPINFIFKLLGDFIYEKVETMDINILVRNEFDSRELLILVDVHKGKETLGVFMAPNRDMSNVLTALNRKVAK